MTARRRARKPQPITETREVVVGWRIVCAQCRAEFESKRADARYCSTRCRMAAMRGRAK